MVIAFFVIKKVKLENNVGNSLKPILISNFITTVFCFILVNLSAIFVFNDDSNIQMTLLIVSSIPIFQIVILLLYYVVSNWTDIRNKVSFFDVFWGVVASYNTTFLLTLVEVFFYYK